MSAETSSCPRCGALAAAGQEYCLECGLRLPGRARLGTAADRDPRAAAQDRRPRPPRLRGRRGRDRRHRGRRPAPARGRHGHRRERHRADPGGRALQPPRGLAAPARSGWTIVLASIPKTSGRDDAVAVRAAGSHPRARACRCPRLVPVREPPPRLLDDRSPAVYQSEADATGALRSARAAVKSARVQRDRALRSVALCWQRS